MRSFILGNGFDVDHKLPTKFCNFKGFLEQTYVPTFNREFPSYPNVGLGHKGEIVVDANASSSILYSLVSQIDADSDWNNFENELGQLEYQTMLDMIEEDEENLFHYYEDLEDLVNDLEPCLCYSVSNIFKEWVDGIDLSFVEPKYKLNDNDLFLTFNYTRVLEDIYKIKEENICHIHIKDDMYVVGHDEDRDFDVYDEVVSFNLEQIHEKLRKDTNGCYYEKLTFFNKIYNSDIDEIVFFGFSFNTMDCFYIEELFKHIDTTNTIIYFSEYEFDNELDEKTRLLKLCGYKGNTIKKFI